MVNANLAHTWFEIDSSAMHEHPTQGVKNAKPRLSSRPGPKIGKLSEEYLGIRNRQMNTKALTAEMQLAEDAES
jgi:hypothetical protein